MSILRRISLITILIAIIISFTGCKDSNSIFSGSRTGNDNQFLIDFDVLNSTVDSNIPLSDGETIESAIVIKKGTVDILVKNENGTIAYQENNVESGSFTIDINETGNYTFYVTGSKAEGSVHFIKSSSDNTD